MIINNLKKILIITVMIFIAFAILGIAYAFLYGIPQVDELVCEANDGSKFILKSNYTWTPINFNPVHPSTRNNQTEYRIFYKKRKYSKMEDTHATLNYDQIDAPGAAEDLCAQVGVKDGMPLVFLSWRSGSGEWYDWPNDFPDSLYTYTKDGTTAFIRRQLDNKHIDGNPAYYTTARVMEKENKLIYELPVINNKLKIVSVLKSVSINNGRTWSKLELTSMPMIFELERSFYEQSFSSIPVFINGDKVVKGSIRKSRGTVNGVRN